MQEDSDASDNFPGLEKNQQIDERENHELSDLWQNKTHSTLRMKKLIASVIAEFKAANQNMQLSEEELQAFNRANNEQPLHDDDNFDLAKEFLQRSNVLLVGSNSDDLRKYIIHAFQQQVQENVDGNQPIDQRFDVLKYPKQVVENIKYLLPPFNSYQSVVQSTKRRQEKRRDRLSQDLDQLASK